MNLMKKSQEISNKFKNQLSVANNEIIVTESQTSDLTAKWLTLLVVLMCGVFSAVLIIKTDSIFRYLAIPISILFILYYAIMYAGIGRKVDNLIIKIDNSGLKYNDSLLGAELSWNQISHIEDKSFYYSGSDSSDNEWIHKINITYADNDGSQKALILVHNLAHQDHVVLIEHMMHFFESQR